MACLRDSALCANSRARLPEARFSVVDRLQVETLQSLRVHAVQWALALE